MDRLVVKPAHRCKSAWITKAIAATHGATASDERRFSGPSRPLGSVMAGSYQIEELVAPRSIDAAQFGQRGLLRAS
ncbi:MAG TPA: hypothetical protein VHN14_09035 [Kofleriaceae bacterium]|jgi:hypothetical protein|nr:hypothetical protein [Kofleriaceae bacterium]